ncbi:MAG: FtsX-like permease family protein [Bacteroidia bacterium]|nr:FtsX-like permease family protein [Bacteroidia bacterium]
MLQNYFKIAWRNIVANKGFSAINVGGLSVGMAVTILIGLWIFSELSFNKNFENYDRIVQVWQHNNYNGLIGSQVSNPAAMGEAIRSEYGDHFEHVLQASWNNNRALAYGDKLFFESGNYFESGVTEMLSLDMVWGGRNGLDEVNSILLSESVAEVFFGEENPVGKIIRLDNKVDLSVGGVYKDLPETSTFYTMKFILPWKLYLSQNPWIEKMENPWGSNFTQTFAQLTEQADVAYVSTLLKDIKLNRVSEGGKKFKPEVFLLPMSRWHLYSNFENGINTGGRIDNVYLFGIIGIFVLLLACINFMNLSTARSEKRAKEVGIRKAIGSLRIQLVSQFFSESILISFIAFLFSIILVILILPYFNLLADSKISILWTNPYFWLLGILFSFLTGILAGVYPALYLSSFNPVTVLKGAIKTGKTRAIPRKILVVSQFAISITLIIGTFIVYQQIKHAQNRPLGYQKDGLITVGTNPETHKHLEVIRNSLINAGAIVEMTEAQSPITAVWNTNGGIEWEGKDPDFAVDFPNNSVNYEYGKTIGWNIIEGRDFSRDFGMDSLAFIVNKSAADFMGMEDPIGKQLRWNDKAYTIIGMVEDMLIQSPYKPVRPSLFHLSTEEENVFILKLHPEKNPLESLQKIEKVFLSHNPAIPFDAEFVDEEFAKKFGNERRIASLAAFFTALAIFISCLGLFGLASYVAEQRTKEIGIRKVLGASVPRLWQLLSKDFIGLVLIACFIAVPLAYYFMHEWLHKYDYHTSISWWVFLIACLGALSITLLTVSYQAIKAATANPIQSLRAE